MKRYKVMAMILAGIIMSSSIPTASVLVAQAAGNAAEASTEQQTQPTEKAADTAAKQQPQPTGNVAATGADVYVQTVWGIGFRLTKKENG